MKINSLKKVRTRNANMFISEYNSTDDKKTRQEYLMAYYEKLTNLDYWMKMVEKKKLNYHLELLNLIKKNLNNLNEHDEYGYLLNLILNNLLINVDGSLKKSRSLI
jgi:hypothetical protein